MKDKKIVTENSLFIELNNAVGEFWNSSDYSLQEKGAIVYKACIKFMASVADNIVDESMQKEFITDIAKAAYLTLENIQKNSAHH